MRYVHYFLGICSVFVSLAMLPGCDAETTDGGASGNGQTTTGGPIDETGAMSGMTAEHNAVRAKVMPAAATPLPELTWSPEIAAVAQAYADKCIWEHSSNQYGENLYATSGGGTPADVVGSWASEVADYDYDANTCAPNKACGHYTQIVWADSLKLGCGMAKCPDNAPWGNGPWEIWVCNYDPPGNWVGEKPY
jgi:pathogenesis-related protein 1